MEPTPTTEDVKSSTVTSELLDVYVCRGEHETTRLQQLLEELGIESLVRPSGSSILPTNVGNSDDYVIAVPSFDWTRARSVILDALSDDFISHDGEFVTPEGHVSPQI